LKEWWPQAEVVDYKLNLYYILVTATSSVVKNQPPPRFGVRAVEKAEIH
jgi:hypothetical protein